MGRARTRHHAASAAVAGSRPVRPGAEPVAEREVRVAPEAPAQASARVAEEAALPRG